MSRFQVFLALGFVSFFAIGCGGQAEQDMRLKVGTVDVLRVLEQRPETLTIKLEWASQAGSTYLAMSEVADQAEALTLRKQIEESGKVWRNRMDEYMENSIKLIERETAGLARERDLDIVVVHNSLTETVKYVDGEDLSTDISLKLQNLDD